MMTNIYIIICLLQVKMWDSNNIFCDNQYNFPASPSMTNVHIQNAWLNIYGDPLKRIRHSIYLFNPATFLCPSQVRTPIYNVICIDSFICSGEMWFLAFLILVWTITVVMYYSLICDCLTFSGIYIAHIQDERIQVQLYLNITQKRGRSGTTRTMTCE